MVNVPWSPAQTTDQLNAQVDPVMVGQPEVVVWNLYDTQTITTASSSTIVFYQSIPTDKSLGNMEGPGQLPDPQYLIVYYTAFDFVQDLAATALAGEPNSNAANISQVLWTGRAFFEFNMSNKRYGGFPLSMTAGTGGVTGSGYGYGSATNGTSMFAANNGIPGSGGYPWNGCIVIPPKIGFNFAINFGAAPTIVGTLRGRISNVGALYRRVL